MVAVSATLAAGRFGTTLHDQLVVAYAVGPDATVKVITVDFDAQGKPVQKATKDLGVTLGNSGRRGSGAASSTGAAPSTRRRSSASLPPLKAEVLAPSASSASTRTSTPLWGHRPR